MLPAGTTILSEGGTGRSLSERILTGVPTGAGGVISGLTDGGRSLRTGGGVGGRTRGDFGAKSTGFAWTGSTSGGGASAFTDSGGFGVSFRPGATKFRVNFGVCGVIARK